MSDDVRWPRASAWLASGRGSDLAVLGVPTHLTSISPTGADATPAAIRAALARYSTYAATHGVDISTVGVSDLGDVAQPDEDEASVIDRAGAAAGASRLLVALGGDNSLTYGVARGVWGEHIGSSGLVTLDAHHDLRDGISNGSPVRRLIEAGLAGTRVVQVGIADFSNSPEYAARARDLGITVITRGALSASTQEIAAATQTRVRALDLRRSGHKGGVVLPVLPGASEFSRYEAERSTIAAMCHVLRERSDLRLRLEEPARMQRLATELQRKFMTARATPQKPSGNTADVLRAMRQAGYVHPFGRPLSRADIDRSTLVVDEVRTRVLTDPHRSGRPINTALVDRLVRSHYLDVEPWPFAVLTGPV